MVLILLTLTITSLVWANNIRQIHAISLDGHHLTIEEVVKIARSGILVKIDHQALEKVKRSHQLLLLAAERNMPVYGLNRGVGLNKDKTIFKGNVLTPQARKESERFNMNDIYATSAAVGSNAPREVVRAAMVARLNTLLLGNAGVQPAVVEMFVALLNNDITPVFPSGGSIGEADITLLAHIGLAMAGKGDVLYKGKQMPASKALKMAGLQPLHLYAKDALSIFSSNAYTAGMAALATYNVEKLINKYELLTALSLEGINGNVAPFLERVHAIRPYQGQGVAARHVIHALQGSYLLEISPKRALQDPLSFRTASQVSGATRDALNDLKSDLTIQLNSSDDNPAVVVDIMPDKEASLQEKAYYVSNANLSGAVIPTANFEPVSWVLDIEKLNIALGHMSASSTQRIVKLGTVCINQISRFLSPDQATIAFAAIQKPVMYLNTEIQQQSIPVSTISYPVAGEIEDTATNSLLVVQHLNKITGDLYQIMGFELMHASQAIDLKKLKTPSLPFGKQTMDLYFNFRKVVPFLKKDRPLTPDIKKAFHFIRSYNTTPLIDRNKRI
ncbi:Histidine ammonia-lyase [Legionella clemsonensis]|uniref:Histidine ammonia-lyase n=2 Tax=Legionella clemsonensis TaxID=1867846 RepID=A0A222P3S0_9GAMM|nr:Histidine ammonia-lyase [Legionella clemsonensis]